MIPWFLKMGIIQFPHHGVVKRETTWARTWTQCLGSSLLLLPNCFCLSSFQAHDRVVSSQLNVRCDCVTCFGQWNVNKTDRSFLPHPFCSAGKTVGTQVPLSTWILRVHVEQRWPGKPSGYIQEENFCCVKPLRFWGHLSLQDNLVHPV